MCWACREEELLTWWVKLCCLQVRGFDCRKGWPGLFSWEERSHGANWDTAEPSGLFAACFKEETVVFRLSSWEGTLKTPLRKNCCTLLVISILSGFWSIDRVFGTAFYLDPFLKGHRCVVLSRGCAHGDIFAWLWELLF